jgi:hypothetical protein
LAGRRYQHTPETADVGAELVVPLIVDGDVWGAINIEESGCDAFDHDDVILLSTSPTRSAPRCAPPPCSGAWNKRITDGSRRAARGGVVGR